MSESEKSSPRPGSSSSLRSRRRSTSEASLSEEHRSEDEERTTETALSRSGTKTATPSSTTNKPSSSGFWGVTPRRNQGTLAQPPQSSSSSTMATAPVLFGKVKRSSGPNPLLADDVEWMTLDVLKDTPKLVEYEGVLKWTPPVDKTAITKDPIVCSLKINTSETVLKVNSPDAKLHILNSVFLSKLGLSRTMVPNVQIVSPQRCADLIGMLPHDDGSGLLDGLTLGLKNPDFPAQLSEMVQGINVSKLNPLANGQEFDTLTNFAKIGRRKAFTAIIKSLKDSKLRSVDQIKWNKNMAEAKELAAAVAKTGAVQEDLMTAIKFLTTSSRINSESGKLLAGLDALATDTVKIRMNQLIALDAATRAWRNFLADPQGAAALAAIGTADFILGMDDRLMGKFNGANFMFDADQKIILLVDNGKNVTGARGLIGYEPTRGTIDINHVNDNKSWDQWRTQQEKIFDLDRIVDILFNNIYEAPEIKPILPDGINLAPHKAAMKSAVIETLKKFKTLAFKTDPGKALGLPGLTEALQGRLQALNIQPVTLGSTRTAGPSSPTSTASKSSLSSTTSTSSPSSTVSTSTTPISPQRQPQPQPQPTARPPLERRPRFDETTLTAFRPSDPKPVVVTVPSGSDPNLPSSATLSAQSDVQPRAQPRNPNEQVPIRGLVPQRQPLIGSRGPIPQPLLRPVAFAAPTLDTATSSVASTSTATTASSALPSTTPDTSASASTANNPGGQSGTGSEDNGSGEGSNNEDPT